MDDTISRRERFALILRLAKILTIIDAKRAKLLRYDIIPAIVSASKRRDPMESSPDPSALC